MTAKAVVGGQKPAAPARTRKRLPVTYSDAIAARIIDAVSEGKTFTDIAREPWSPNRRTLFRWADAYPALRDGIEVARKQAADKLFAELLEIKDKLRNLDIDYKDAKSLVAAGEIIKWSLARLDAARWGDKRPTTPAVAVQINTTLDLGQNGAAAVDGGNVYRLEVPAHAVQDAVDV